MEIHIIEDGQKRLLSLSRRCVNPPRPNKFYFFGSRSHRMLLVILHHSRIHFGIYSSVLEDRFSYHFFLCPKIGYHMLAWLSYTRTIWYHTSTSRYPLERGGTNYKKKFVGCEFTHLHEAVISLPQHTSTQINKSQFFFCTKVFYLRNRLLCICYAKKVISLDRYMDTHTKWPIFYLCICFLLFVARIEGQIFVSFWDTKKYTDAK